jgi:CDP-6-deoxy-D-xylo-4-hexulose-3-dehydrase
MQAAIGCAQLDKLSSFIAQRKANWLYFYQHLRDFRDTIFLPEAEDNSQPSWFGFLITMRPDSGLSRDKVVRMLESRGIQTRMLFAGNLTKHPCFDEMRVDGHGYRVVGNLEHTDLLMNNAFWLGVYPGLTREMLDYVIDSLSTVLGKGDK